MKKFSFYIAFLCGLFLFVGMGLVQAYEPQTSGSQAIAPVPELFANGQATSPLVLDSIVDPLSHQTQVLPEARVIAATDSTSEEEDASEDEDLPNLQPFDKVIKKTRKSEGLFTLYR